MSISDAIIVLCIVLALISFLGIAIGIVSGDVQKFEIKPLNFYSVSTPISQLDYSGIDDLIDSVKNYYSPQVVAGWHCDVTNGIVTVGGCARANNFKQHSETMLRFILKERIQEFQANIPRV